MALALSRLETISTEKTKEDVGRGTAGRVEKEDRSNTQSRKSRWRDNKVCYILKALKLLYLSKNNIADYPLTKMTYHTYMKTCIEAGLLFLLIVFQIRLHSSVGTQKNLFP